MNLNFFRGKFKGFFFVLRLHIFLNWIAEKLIFLGNLIKLSKWISSQKGLEMNDFYTFNLNYNKRTEMYEHIIKKEKLNTPIDYIEFGVYDGGSFLWWANRNKESKSNFYGFDTFEGLPENWGSFKKGDMQSNIPQVDDTRCHFYKGLFQDTVPGFMKNYNSTNKLVVHFDADLFTSTLYGLTSIAPILKKGDIIIFDEFNVPMHEFYAWEMFVKSYYLKYEVLAGINNFYQTAFKIV